MKIIGITPRVLTDKNGVQKEFVNSRYVKPLTNRYFNVIMLTLDNPNLEDVLKLCDGFLITGGADIDPQYWNEENAGLSQNVNHSLDILDKKVVEYATENKLPVLGICRGEQAINVFLGGTLHQDIGEDHKSIKFDHIVNTSKNRMFDFKDTIITNSYHHQAVKDLAPGMEIIARHQDGTIEAFIHETLPIIAIQWHPEMIPDTEESMMIFDLFAKYVNN